jgi:hypothetical protein
MGDSVFRVVLFASLLEVVSGNLKDLEFVVQATEILDTVIKVGEAILSNRKYVKFAKSFEAGNSLDLVRVKTEVGDFGAVIKALNGFNGVERKVKPLKVD